MIQNCLQVDQVDLEQGHLPDTLEAPAETGEKRQPFHTVSQSNAMWPPGKAPSAPRQAC